MKVSKRKSIKEFLKKAANGQDSNVRSYSLGTYIGKTAVSIQDMITEISSYSKAAVERVEIAENIVSMQEKSVRNTTDAFNNLNHFLEQMIQEMETLAMEVEGMNTERKTTLHSIHSIAELSEKLVQFS